MAKKPVGKARKPKASKGEYANFAAATISPSDLMARYRGNPAVRDLIDSCKSWAAICANLKAEQASSYPIRLYGRSDKGRKGSKIQGKRLADLRRIDVAGSKSAQYAESAGSNVVEISADPALNVLHKPNPFVNSGHELFYWLYLLQEACGNAFTEAVETDDPSKPYDLLPMFPQDVAIVPNKGDEDIPSLVSKYLYGRGTKQIEYAWDEVIHFKRAPSMYSPLWGASPLQGVRSEADLLEMATLNELANWQNGCAVDLAYQVPPDTTETQVKQIRSQIEARHQGADKAGRVFIGVGELKRIGATAREMQYRDGQTYYSQLILSAYRVPESKVRINTANLGSSRTGDIEFLTEAIRPMLVRMAETLTEELLYKRLGYERGSVWFAFDDIVPRDIQAINAAAVGLVQNRIWTPDEARAELGYGPLPDGKGAELVAQVGGMATPAAPIIDGEKVPQAPQGPSLGTATSAPPEGFVDHALTVAQMVAKSELPAAAAKELLYAAYPSVSRETVSAIIDGAEKAKPEEPKAPEPVESPAAVPPQPEGKSLAAPSVQRWETVKGPEGKSLKSKRAADGGLHVLGGRTLRAVDAQGKGITDDAIAALVERIKSWYASAPIDGGDLDSRAADLAKILRPQLEAIFRAGGIEGLETLAGIAGGAERITATGVSFDVVPERALAFLDKYTIKLARSITETQQDDLKSALSAAIEQGMNTAEAKRAVQDVLPEAAAYKAEEIARTESTRAYTSGNLAAWTEAGVERKQWLLAPDACPMCLAVSAKFKDAVPLGDPFLKLGDSFEDETGREHRISYSDVDAPPLHPGDRCDVLPVL